MNLKRIRQLKGLTQRDLAEMAGLEQPTVSKIEQGYDGVTLRTLNRIADALDISLLELLGEDRSAAEKAIIAAFRRLSPDRQRGWLDMAEAIAPQQQRDDPEID